ncbi:uncharacterized protein LOC135937437 [Cloeon dipterum]|uniref:uncharacterized protein LOC135937437 n=1 Tax=Cloeon dipterum TaxID=197152 RepID=UPI0032208A18
MRLAILVLAVAVSAFAKTISVADVKNWELITDTSENDTDVSDGSLFGNDNDTSVLEQVQEVIENSGDHVVEFLTIGFVCTEKCVSEFLNFLPCLNKCADEEWNKRHPNNETIVATTVAPNVTTTIAPTNATKSSSRNLATSETPEKDAEVVTEDWLAQTKAECTKACKGTKRAGLCISKCVDDRKYLLRPEISEHVRSVLAECKTKVGDMNEFINCATDLFFAAHREFKPAGLDKINLPPINDKLIEDLNTTIHLCRERCGETDVVVFIFSSCAKTCVHDEFIKLHPEFASIKVPADRNPFPHFQDDDDVLDSSLTFEERHEKKTEGENQVKVTVDSLPKTKGLVMTSCEEQCVTSANQESCLLLCQAELILANLRRMSGKPSEIDTRQHITSKFQFGGVFTEMAEEITSILDGVVFRQQEMMQMLIGCKCAGSTTNVTIEEEESEDEDDDEALVVEDPTVTESEVDAFDIETVNKLPGETVANAPTDTVTLAPVQIVTTPVVVVDPVTEAVVAVQPVTQAVVVEPVTQAVVVVEPVTQAVVVDPVTEAIVVDPVTEAPAQSVTETLVAETVTEAHPAETVTTAPAEVVPEVPEEVVTEAVVVEVSTSKVPEPITEAQTQLVTETIVAETVTKAPEELVTDSVVVTVTEAPAQSVTEAPAETVTKEPVQNVTEGTVTEAEENHKEETSQVPDGLMK